MASTKPARRPLRYVFSLSPALRQPSHGETASAPTATSSAQCWMSQTPASATIPTRWRSPTFTSASWSRLAARRAGTAARAPSTPRSERTITAARPARLTPAGDHVVERASRAPAAPRVASKRRSRVATPSRSASAAASAGRGCARAGCRRGRSPCRSSTARRVR